METWSGRASASSLIHTFPDEPPSADRVATHFAQSATVRQSVSQSVSWLQIVAVPPRSPHRFYKFRQRTAPFPSVNTRERFVTGQLDKLPYQLAYCNSQPFELWERALTLCFKQTRTMYCRTLGEVLRDTVHLPTEFVRNEKYECVFEADARPRRCPPPRVLISRTTGGSTIERGEPGGPHITGTTV
jgi:hypothetical protein